MTTTDDASPAARPADPRVAGRRLRQFSTAYVEPEDRIRIIGTCTDGTVIVMWMTQRLMRNLLTVVTEWLSQRDAAAGQTPQASDRPDKGSSATAPGARPRAPAPSIPGASRPSLQDSFGPTGTSGTEATSVLVRSVVARGSSSLLTLRFQGGGDAVAELTFTPMLLRQWLDVVQRCWTKAAWTDAMWREWLLPREAQQRSALH